MSGATATRVPSYRNLEGPPRRWAIDHAWHLEVPPLSHRPTAAWQIPPLRAGVHPSAAAVKRGWALATGGTDNHRIRELCAKFPAPGLLI